MTGVEQALVEGVAVDGGHQTAFDAECFVDNFRYWSQAVGGAAGVRDDVVLLGVVVFVVDAENNGDVFICCRCRDKNLLGAGGDVTFCLFCFGENTGALEHDVDFFSRPRAGRRVFFFVELDFLAVYFETVFELVNFERQFAEDGVILQQMRRSRQILQRIVDGDDFELFSGVVQIGTEGVAADTTEPVNCYSYHLFLFSHGRSVPLVC